MPRLVLSLFGPTHCTLDGASAAQLPYDKVRALLAYLVTESDRPHRRERLAGLLWPDQEESAARHSLNQALWSLRQALDDRNSDAPLVLSTRETARFNLGADSTVDVFEFESLFDRVNRHVHRKPETCRRCIGCLAQAIDLYRGPFLEQFSLADSADFEEWMLVKRERFHHMTVGALDRLVDFSERRHADLQAIAYLRRLLELDPLREDSHRRLMRLLNRSGQRPAALAHFERLRAILAEDLGTDVEQETLDLRDEIERGSSGRGAATAKLPNPSVPLAHLPSRIGPLIGRERVLGELVDLIAGGEHQLITLIGPGGIGKTRLALQLAYDENETFDDGACFVPLAGVQSANSLVQAIADARSLTFYGNRDPRRQLLDDLRDLDLLLVLDNFEHLLDGADLVTEIIDRAPNIQILVTSRERLNLYGEYVLPVTALEIPSLGNDQADIERTGAVQLFVRSAQRANANFIAQSSDLPAIIDICKLVGGMPLGIELAAAWSPLLTCHEIAQEIERSLDFLTTSLRDVPERHRSVRAAFDHSWRLLTDHERDVFMRLSVFRAGFRKEAAELVAGATLPSLLALMSKSFLVRSPVGRFDIHELLRQYANDKLKEQPSKMDATFDAHAGYYAEFLVRREERLKGREQVSALQELISESENIRAAWNWALTQFRVDILETLVQAWLFYEFTGRYREIDELLGQAIAVLEQTHDDRAEVAVGRALTRQAVGIVRVGAFDDALPVLERAQEILRRQGEFAELALDLNFVAMNVHAHGDYEKERQLLEESLRMSRPAGDEWLTAYSLNDLGMVECLLGDRDSAQRMIQESLQIFISIGDRRGEAFALNNLGTVVAGLGSHAEARRLHQESLQIRRSMGNRWGEAQSLTKLGIVARMIGDFQRSGEHFREALRIASDLHAYPLVLEVLTEMADLFAVQEDGDRAQTIRERVAEYTTGSPSIAAKARRALHSSADVLFGGLASNTLAAATIAELDEAVSLALQDDPGMAANRHRRTTKARNRHSVR